MSAPGPEPDQTPGPGPDRPLLQTILIVGLTCIGYVALGLVASIALSLLSFLAGGEFQTRWSADVSWQEPVGYALGYATVSMLIAILVFSVLTVSPALRFRLGFWLAVGLANAFVLTAYWLGG